MTAAMPGPEVIADYDRWLHKVANEIGDPASHDDLVQEGRIAMWRALETFDESRGALPTWLTGAARQRMRDLAWGHGRPLGHEATRGIREVRPDTSLDAMPTSLQEGLIGGVMMAYHETGNISEAIDRLPREWQEYLFLRFWCGLDPQSRDPGMRTLVEGFPVLAKRHIWQKVKPILAAAAA